MVKDKELEELAHPEYWDKRYTSEQQKGEGAGADGIQQPIGSFEWFRTFENLQPFLTKYLPAPETGCQILHLGCGNSTLTADLHTLGYTHQTSIDFSTVIIATMKAKHASSLPSTIHWEVMDVRNLEIPNTSIEVAIDKGTLDAMIHGSLWDPPNDVRENVGAYVGEVSRVLKPGGLWLYITYRQPHFMKPLLAREDIWTLDVEILDDGQGGFEYFGFIMRKKKIV
ncbi:MAG: hypothetical protein MMC33_006782 [Icmadophila ericetorum]|nr:hypothetical protein [Icmadophila ericetorum]